MEEIEENVDVENMIHEWRPSIPFINPVSGAYGPCIQTWPHLQPIISVDVGFSIQ
jgi:hypothetical protein